MDLTLCADIYALCGLVKKKKFRFLADGSRKTRWADKP